MEKKKKINVVVSEEVKAMYRLPKMKIKFEIEIDADADEFKRLVDLAHTKPFFCELGKFINPNINLIVFEYGAGHDPEGRPRGNFKLCPA